MEIEIVGLGYVVQLEVSDPCVHGYGEDAMDYWE